MFDVIVFGNATRDVILKSREFQFYKDHRFDTGWAQSFAFGSKVDVDELHISVGGGGVNTATTFARQHFGVALVGKVGEDEPGHNVLEHLVQERIATDYVIASADTQTAYSTVLLGPEAERTILTYRGEAQEFGKKELDVTSLQAHWFYITSLSGQMKLLKKIMEHARKKNIKLAINPGSAELAHKDFPKLLKDVDVLIVNKEEAHALLPSHAREASGIFPAIFRLMKGVCIITDGTNGAACSDGQTIYYIGVPKEKVVDRLGTGDAFGSGFVSGYIKSGGLIEHALQVAITNASGVCAHHGATTGIIHAREKILDLPIHKSPL